MSDTQFAAAVLLNQVNFNREGYLVKKFRLLEPDDGAEHSFTKDLQKYLNHITKTRLCLYRNTMRGIKADATVDVLNAEFANLMSVAALELEAKGYSHRHFLEFLADVCTYTRCLRLKGIEYCCAGPIQLIKNTISKLRDKDLFSDATFTKLDVWISNEIEQYEMRKGTPMSLCPVELSLDWVNCCLDQPATSSASGSSAFHDYDDNIGDDVREKSDSDTPRKRKRLRI